MIQFWRQHSWKARSILILMVYTLGMSILGNLTVLDRIGKVDIQAWLYWNPGHQCFNVSSLSSPKWEPLRTGALWIGDCLVTIDGIPIQSGAELSQHLESIYARAEGLRHVLVEGYRSGEFLQVKLRVIRWTLAAILQAQLLVVIPGLALWLIGAVAFLAQPESTTNQALGAFLLLAGMLLMGINHWFGDYTINALYDLGVNVLPRALFIVLIVKTAIEFPTPMRSARWRKALMIASLSIMVWVFLAYFSEAFVFPDRKETTIFLEKSARTLSVTGFLVAGFFFIGRLWSLQKRSPNPKVRQQSIFIALGWMSCLPLLILDALSTIPNHSWAFTRFSNLTTVGWIIPGAAMFAYAMLRYQAFAYRGRFLSLLLIFFISATIVQIYTMVVMWGQVDGIEWVLLWGIVLITTALFYVDTPLRRAFVRYFARHYYDYEIINQFSRQIEPYRDLHSLMEESVVMLCKYLDVDWVCIWSTLLPEKLFVMRWKQTAPRAFSVTERPDPTHCPGQPVHEELLDEGTERLGVIWFGPRVTAEPFDEKDQRLAHLLALELARVMALRSYISQLEETPGLILAAVDRERRRIGQDIHDGVLQFLGVLPLSLERAKRLWGKDPAKANAVLDGLEEQSQRVTEDARSMVYDLSLPGIRQGRLLPMAYQYVATVCNASGVRLEWEVHDSAQWGKIRDDASVHVFRILQEGVHNAIRHGRPQEVSIRWRVEKGVYVLEISDDGQGIEVLQPPPQQNGLGMISMRERARALGGSLEVISTSRRGMTLRLIFPLA